MDVQDQTEIKVTTSDGIEFSIVTNDVIALTSDQFNDIVSKAVRRKADYIVLDGIDILPLTPDQVTSVLSTINSIIGESTDPIGDNLIRLSSHVASDHATNPELMQKRGWYRATVDEVYADIVSVIKKANQVQKAKLKFDPLTNQTIEKFTFTVLGLKVNGDKGRLTIAFLEDKQDFIFVVTIL